jgi:isoquinoline 1-oxidoreductase subunit beta
MTVTRRHFLKIGAAAGGGLMVGFQLTGCSAPADYPHAQPGSFQPNAFLQLTAEGQFILQLHKAEMGQGVYTGMATLAAEELGVSPQDLQIEHAEFHPDFTDPVMKSMITGGSSSIRSSYLPLREAAASLALVLRQAAEKLGVGDTRQRPLAQLLANLKSVDRLPELISVATTLPVPEQVELKPESEFEYIGRFNTRLDARDKVRGRSQFSLDVPLEDAAVAVLVRCPHIGGHVTSIDDSAAQAMPGVVKILEVDGAVVVIAEGYWFARQAAAKLKLSWDKGPLAGVSSESLLEERHRLAQEEEGRTAEEEGEASLAVGDEFKVTYEAPYLAHATMEPLNALARVTEDRAEIWAGNQAPDMAIGLVAAATGLEFGQISLYNQMLGGGFGRRVFPDYIVEAARVSQLAGMPVRLVWSREDDVQHDGYRPNASAFMSATIADNKVTSMQSKVVTPSIYGNFMPLFTKAKLPNWVPDLVHRGIASLASGHDSSAVEGLIETGYTLPYTRCNVVLQDTTVPIGFWRSVGHSQNAFFKESFVDELAHQCGRDPLEFRLSLLQPGSGLEKVLSKVAELASWGGAGENRFQGVAVHESFHTAVAEVVTLHKTPQGLKLEQVHCVVDCGQTINPEIIEAQMESGIIFGLTAALKGKIDLVDGAVQQSNFHDYPMLRMSESPAISVHIMASDAEPTGVGEPGTPPVAPALANALYAATGERQRKLPLRLG